MSREKRTSLKSKLAAAIAEGKSCAEWASANRIGERTAQRWANQPETRAEVESIRRESLDLAVGRMSRRVTWATDEIEELAKSAKSESVRLMALRSIMSDMMAVSDFTGLEQRIAKLEEQDQVRHAGGEGQATLGSEAQAMPYGKSQASWKGGPTESPPLTRRPIEGRCGRRLERFAMRGLLATHQAGTVGTTLPFGNPFGDN